VKNKMDEFEKFYAKIWESGDSLIITIPSNLVKIGGYKKGDSLKVMTRKVAENEDKAV
jgi:hypothetical protein